MEKGFFHPNRGYWQTISEPTQNVLSEYPEGTVEVPIKPSGPHEWDGTAWVEMPAPPPTPADVKAERDRRLAADFTFNGNLFQRDPTSLARITGAATLAGFAVAAGSPAGNLRWANPDRDFEWIASDDTRVPMDAQTAFAFGQAAAQVETTLVFAASTLRSMDPIPTNYTDDSWWI